MIIHVVNVWKAYHLLVKRLRVSFHLRRCFSGNVPAFLFIVIPGDVY